jgi:hypothetical protein
MAFTSYPKTENPKSIAERHQIHSNLGKVRKNQEIPAGSDPLSQNRAYRKTEKNNRRIIIRPYSCVAKDLANSKGKLKMPVGNIVLLAPSAVRMDYSVYRKAHCSHEICDQDMEVLVGNCANLGKLHIMLHSVWLSEVDPGCFIESLCPVRLHTDGLL